MAAFKTMLDAITSTATSDIVVVRRNRGKFTFEVEIDGTASVQAYRSLDNSTWTACGDAVASSDFINVDNYGYNFVKVTATIDSATVSVRYSDQKNS